MEISLPLEDVIKLQTFTVRLKGLNKPQLEEITVELFRQAKKSKIILAVMLKERKSSELTLEEKFEIQSVQTLVSTQTREQLLSRAAKIFEHQLDNQNIYKEKVKHSWGI